MYNRAGGMNYYDKIIEEATTMVWKLDANAGKHNDAGYVMNRGRPEDVVLIQDNSKKWIFFETLRIKMLNAPANARA